MLPSFRILALAALGAIAGGYTSRAADDGLPPESSVGEWIQDTLDDGNLWFASSDNLDFEAIARELTDYSQGRRWVRVVDGKPAWVMYYVPGEILGFEVDTHHYGAAATEFHFTAGATWDSLAAVEADYEEIVTYEAKWLRLYRAADQLPPGTHFLKIEFPQDADADAARLTEVWLRCQFDEPVTPPEANQAPIVPAEADSTSTPSIPLVSGPEVEPIIVTAFLYRLMPPAEPVFPPVSVDAVWPPVQIETPLQATRYDLFGDLVPLVETPAPGIPQTSTNVFSRILDLFRPRSGR